MYQAEARNARYGGTPPGLTGARPTSIVNPVVTEQVILSALRTVRDPDQEQDIVSLGLVKDLVIQGPSASLLTITANVTDPKGGTNATRVSNTGAGPLAIQQIVNGPGWYQYAFGLQARSDQEQQVTLIRSTATQTHSVAFSIGHDER